MHSSSLSPEAQGSARVFWEAGEHETTAGAGARAKRAGTTGTSPTRPAACSAVGEADTKAGVAMPLAP